MDISLRQLEAFIKVAEHRSFSKAGDELFLSQSTISSHVAQLEQSLQVTLIKRREKKNIELTEEGQRAYRAAQIIINQAEMLQNMFRKEEADQPLISIAASTVPSSYILPGIMTGFSDIRPECRFSVLDGDSSFAIGAAAKRRGCVCVCRNQQPQDHIQLSYRLPRQNGADYPK